MPSSRNILGQLIYFIKALSHLLSAICESSSGVEHHLAKVRVAGSNPVFRSTARVVELVDTLDLKSNEQ